MVQLTIIDGFSRLQQPPSDLPVVLLAIIDENRIRGEEMNIKEPQTADHRAAISRESRRYRGKCHLISKRGSCWVCGHVLVVSRPGSLVRGKPIQSDLPVVLSEPIMEPRRDE